MQYIYRLLEHSQQSAGSAQTWAQSLRGAVAFHTAVRHNSPSDEAISIAGQDCFGLRPSQMTAAVLPESDASEPTSQETSNP